MRNALIICLVLFFSITASAGEPSKSTAVSVEGKVVDAENAEALTGASILIVELNLVAYASFDGSFSFGEIPVGTYTVEVSYIGHTKQVHKSWVIKEAQTFRRFYL